MKPNCSESREPRVDRRDQANPPAATWLRWLANYGLSLSAVDCAVEAPDERGSRCPFAELLKPAPRRA